MPMPYTDQYMNSHILFEADEKITYKQICMCN